MLAPLPGGSTNVYSQTLGYPRHADDAARALLQALERETLHRVGVGMANDRPFLFCAGIGFDASVIRRVERHGRRLKRLASHPLHIVAALRTFFGAEARHVRVDLALDGVAPGGIEKIGDVRFAIISKTTPYTHLGRLPLNVNRNAGLDTRLSLTAFTRLRALGLIGGAASSIRTGRFLNHRKEVVQIDDLGGLQVRSDAPFPYQVDGDDVGDTTELRIGLDDRRAHGCGSAARMTSGMLRDDRVGAVGGERARRLRIVDRPHAHEQTGLVRGRDPRRAGDEGGDHVGVEPYVPVRGRERGRRGDVLAVREPRRSRARAPGRARGRRRRGRTTRRSAARRAPRTASTVARITEPSVSASGSHGRHFTSAFTTSPEHAASASSSVARSGLTSRSAARRSAAIRPAPGTSASWCTTSTPSALRRTSSSTPSAPSARARSNAATVFSGATAEAPR